MIKKYLWITILIFGFISCDTAPNNFTAEANAFLDAIDGKNYSGLGVIGTPWAGSSFEAYGVVISQFNGKLSPNPLNHPMFFQPNDTIGTSPTRAIYRYRITNPPSQGDYVGIEIANSGNLLRRTAASSTPNVNWNIVVDFAGR